VNRKDLEAAAAKTWAVIMAHKVMALIIEGVVAIIVGYLWARWS
jgi:hypothetical protein